MRSLQQIQENFPGLNLSIVETIVKAGQTFVWAFSYRQQYYAHIFLALEDWNGTEQLRVKFIASTDNVIVIGSEQLINPSFEEILVLR
ncbi:MAG: hypothetical protein V7L20_26215 [Nostoc sp.]|uniref:hypothetical protein n=1 Tax=Nostoc sp. TaxID=1180 RepID=UPI002FF5B588